MNKFIAFLLSFLQTLVVWLIMVGILWLITYVYRERGLAATGGLIVLMLGFGGTWVQNYENRMKK